jgi:hypothetical protein
MNIPLHRIALPAIVIPMLFLYGCGGRGDDAVVVRKKNLVLTSGELQSAISAAGARDSAAAASIYLEDWKDMASLYLMAVDDGQEKDPSTLQLAEKARRQIVVHQYITDKTEEAERNGMFRTDSSSVSEFYRKHSDLFIADHAQYSVIRLLASDLKKSMTMAGLLSSEGISSADLSLKVSTIDPRFRSLNKAAIENARIFESAEEIAGENNQMKSALQAMEPGMVSPVVKLGDSLYVVMKMIDVAASGQKMSLRQAYDKAERQLILQKKKAYYYTLLSKARKKYP